MAGRFSHPKFRSFLASGAPNNGGKVYIYETGTTTKVGAGSALDARGGSDVANPLILDAAGEGDLWLAAGAQYTIKVDTSADVQLSSTDGISSDDLSTWVNSGSDIYYSAGNVYIGASSGTETLDVTGTAAISGTLTVAGLITANAGLTLGAGDDLTLSSTSDVIFNKLTASQALFTDASKNAVSNAITGTGNVVMSASPTLTGTITAAVANFSGAVDALTLSTGNETFTYDEGSFTATATGLTTSPTYTVKYVVIGDMVTLFIPLITGTSNATSFGLSGVPAAITPAESSTNVIFGAQNNSAEIQLAGVDVKTDNTIDFIFWSGSAWSSTGWTNSGTKATGSSEEIAAGAGVDAISYILS